MRKGVVEIPTKDGKIIIGQHFINTRVPEGSCYLIHWKNGICVKHEHGLTWEQILEIFK